MTTLVGVKAPRPDSSTRSLVQGARALGRRTVMFLRAWKSRRVVADLLELDDHMLADIGISRADLVSVLSLPADRDPSARLMILAVERRAARRALEREMLERSRVAINCYDAP
jgi:uncharacterized protein YjiS (DUF1127 family)